MARAAMAARRLEQALKAAQAMQSQAAVKGCATCPKEEIPCFNTPANGTNAEMDRQLKEQQDAINKLSPDQVLKNLKNNRDPVTGKIVRPPDDATARSQARSTYQANRADGRSPAQADQDAARDAAKELEGKQMLHTPDLRAGGDGTLSPVPGDAAVNQSIGSQWNTKGDGDGRTRG